MRAELTKIRNLNLKTISHYLYLRYALLLINIGLYFFSLHLYENGVTKAYAYSCVLPDERNCEIFS
jgi:hypothetical protein